MHRNSLATQPFADSALSAIQTDHMYTVSFRSNAACHFKQRILRAAFVQFSDDVKDGHD